MRRSALLLLLLPIAASGVEVAETLTFEGHLTIVPCPGYTLKHYADGILQYKCPDGFKINWPCAKPNVSAPSPSVHHLSC